MIVLSIFLVALAAIFLLGFLYLMMVLGIHDLTHSSAERARREARLADIKMRNAPR